MTGKARVGTALASIYDDDDIDGDDALRNNNND